MFMTGRRCNIPIRPESGARHRAILFCIIVYKRGIDNIVPTKFPEKGRVQVIYIRRSLGLSRTLQEFLLKFSSPLSAGKLQNEGD